MLPPGKILLITMAYGIFVGYEIRKHNIDALIASRIRRHMDGVTQHNAHIFAEEMRKVAEIAAKG